jgi:signal transduction histidine kinase
MPTLNRFGLRAWLFALVAATVLPGAAAVVWLGISSERAAVRDGVRHSEALAINTARRADRSLLEAQEVLQALAGRPLIRSLDAAHCDPILGELRALHLLYTSVDVADASGRVLCTTPPHTAGNGSHTGSRWMREVIERKTFTIGDPQRGYTTARWVAALASPILSADGARGAVVFALDLLEFGGRIHPDDTQLARASVVNQQGILIARSGAGAAELLGQRDEDEHAVAQAVTAPVGSIVRPDRTGVRRIYGIAPIAGGRWRAVVSVPEEQVLGPARARARAALRLGLLAVLLVSVAAYWLSRRLARPILALTEVAKTAAGGTLLARVPEEGPREVRDAMARFNELLEARSRAESALRHSGERVAQLNRLLRTTWSVSRMIAREDDRTSVLRGACRVLVEVGGMSAAWVGFAQPDGKVEPAATHGIEASDLDMVRVDDTPEGLGAFGRAFRSGEPQVVRRRDEVPYLPYRGLAARYGHLSWAAFPLRERSRVTGAIAVYAVEEDAFGEDELELIAELARDIGLALEHLDDRASRKRTQEALQQSEASLIVADRLASLGRLAAGVAHEINNPLAYVVMNTSAALEDLQRALPKADPLLRPGLEEAAAALREARAGSERVRLIVRDLKLFSRVDVEARDPVDLAKVIESSIGIAWNEIRHRARLVKDFSPLPEVVASESRLGQVFLNLLVNAAQAIEPGAPDQNEIRIVTRREGDRAVAEVRDTGCGIPQELRKRIFEPFFTTKPPGVGTGLGLAICHTIVSELRGELTVESTPGKGTTFRVSLPLATYAQTKGAAQVAQPSASPGSPRARLLVVDDEPAVGNAIRRALAAEHDVLAVTSGKAALALLEKGEKFDAVLCDLMMPEMSGMDLHEALGRIAPRLAQGMIVMTGGAFTGRAQQFLDRVPNQRVEKPFDVQSLRAVVRSALR